MHRATTITVYTPTTTGRAPSLARFSSKSSSVTSGTTSRVLNDESKAALPDWVGQEMWLGKILILCRHFLSKLFCQTFLSTFFLSIILPPLTLNHFFNGLDIWPHYYEYLSERKFMNEVWFKLDEIWSLQLGFRAGGGIIRPVGHIRPAYGFILTLNLHISWSMPAKHK